MKNLLSKTLLISLLLSAAIPSDVQAGVFADISGKLTKGWHSSADFRTSAKNRVANFSKQVGEKAGQVWNSTSSFRGNPQRSTVNFLNSEKFISATVVISLVISFIVYTYESGLAATVAKKAKKAWKDKKWLRYSTYGTGTALALTTLYVELARRGHLPEFSAVKSALICAWQEKSLRAARKVAAAKIAETLEAGETREALEAAEVEKEMAKKVAAEQKTADKQWKESSAIEVDAVEEEMAKEVAAEQKAADEAAIIAERAAEVAAVRKVAEQKRTEELWKEGLKAIEEAKIAAAKAAAKAVAKVAAAETVMAVKSVEKAAVVSGEMTKAAAETVMAVASVEKEAVVSGEMTKAAAETVMWQ